MARNGPATASPTAPATATAYPAHHAPRAAARGRGSVPCQCSPSVDTSTIASRAPSQATPTSSASPSSGTSEMVTSPRARFAPDTSSHSAAPVPAACHPSPLDSGSTSQASTTGATTTTSEVSPVSTPTIAPRHQRRPGRRLHGIPRGVVGPGQDGTEAVADRHPDQCARERHQGCPSNADPATRQNEAGPTADRGGDHGPQHETQAGDRPRMISRIRSAVSDGVLPTLTPAASRASFLACAVPDEPETMAPAWPIVLPSGAVNPAT